MDEKRKEDQFDYKIARVFIIIIALCLIAVAIGLTVKFLSWLF